MAVFHPSLKQKTLIVFNSKEEQNENKPDAGPS